MADTSNAHGADGSVNVRVAVRARPLNSREKGLNCLECVRMEGNSTYIKDEKGAERAFAYDQSYWYDTPQQRVYDDLAKPIVDKALDGFNGTIFAYGQTGSGKTHSMIGTGDDKGIVPLLNIRLFESLKDKMAKDGGEYLVTASYLEIYNEVVKDLLNPSDKQLQIREHPKKGIYVDQLAELVVHNAEEIEALLEQGNSVKQVAATEMNARSSRSHSCFVIKLEQRKVEEIGTGDDAVKRETSLASKINLVDLAGSERAGKTGAQGTRLKEGASINQSLSALGQVINMLGEGKGGHIPYRNSKLTRLLQESLGGNALTVMIATVSPADNNFSESLSTLQYASRAKMIKNETHRNEDVSEKVIRELKAEVEKLRAQMAELAANGNVAVSHGGQLSEEEQQRLIDMKNEIASLENAKKSHWEEVQKLSQAYEEERQKNLQNENQVRDVILNVKEANVELMKQLFTMQENKVILTRDFKQCKVEYTGLKSSLDKDMTEYKKLLDAPSSEGSEKQLKVLLLGIETKRQRLVEQRGKLNEIKTKIKQNDTDQVEYRAEMAAQKSLLDEDTELREKIQSEERLKMEITMQDEKERYLETELKAERLRMVQEAESERAHAQRLFEHKQELAVGREVALEKRIYELELLDIRHRSDKKLLVLELEAVEKRAEWHEQQMLEKAYKDQRAALWEQDRQNKLMVQEILAAFEEEQATVQRKLQATVMMLQMASKDVVQLEAENRKLKGALQGQEK